MRKITLYELAIYYVFVFFPNWRDNDGSVRREMHVYCTDGVFSGNYHHDNFSRPSKSNHLITWWKTRTMG